MDVILCGCPSINEQYSKNIPKTAVPSVDNLMDLRYTYNNSTAQNTNKRSTYSVIPITPFYKSRRIAPLR